jgi:hypothetical protein
LSILLSKCADQLDEQLLHRELLEMDLDQHKETLAVKVLELNEKAKELDEKEHIIKAQDFLLVCAHEEAQGLANTNSEKDHIISTLYRQMDGNGIETGKKRKIAP